MTLVRRVRTALVVLPVWIVMILTGGQWCLMSGSVTAHPVVSSASAVGHAAAGHVMAHDDAHPREGQRGAHASSGQPEHGPPGCESQAACSVAIAPAPLFASVPVTPPDGRPARLHVERLSSLTLAPELPPPRA